MGEIESSEFSYSNRATMPEIARVVAEAFPDLEGRALAVSSEEVKDENDLTLPIALIALVNGAPAGPVKIGGSGQRELSDQFAIQFMFKPEKYKRKDGVESPLWAYYDYEFIRDRLFKALGDYASTRDIDIEYLRLGVESTDFAVYVIFLFRQDFIWCDDSESDGEQFSIHFSPGGC